MLYDTVNLYDFERAFEKAGRGDQFSKQGFKALFEYLDNDDVDVKLDPIAFCCGFAEMSEDDLLEDRGYYSLDDFLEDYDYFEDFLSDNYDVIKELPNNNYLIQNQ